MDMLGELAKYMNGWPLWMQGVVGVVFLAKMVTIITPTKVDDALFGKATPFINVLEIFNYFFSMSFFLFDGPRPFP